MLYWTYTLGIDTRSAISWNFYPVRLDAPLTCGGLRQLEQSITVIYLGQAYCTLVRTIVLECYRAISYLNSGIGLVASPPIHITLHCTPQH